MMRALSLALFGLLAACQSSTDLSIPRPYACIHTGTAADEGTTAADSVCPGAWHCGPVNYCYPLDRDPRPYPCDGEQDCAAGWHCGEEHVCYDLSVGRPYACVGGEASADCATGWRCGLDGSCHQRGVTGEYACTADSDCEGGWRCTSLGHCVDLAQGALRPDAVRQPPSARELSTWGKGAFAVSATPVVAQPAAGFGAQASFVSLLSDAGWSNLAFDFGRSPELYPVRVSPAPAGAHAVATMGTSAFLLHAGGVDRIDWSIADGGVYLAGAYPATGDALRVVDAAPELAAVTSDAGFVVLGAPGSQQAFGFASVNGPTPELYGLAGVRAFQAGLIQPALVAATSSGLYLALQSDGGGFLDPAANVVGAPAWMPLEVTGLPNGECQTVGSGELATRILHAAYSNSGTYLVLEVPAASGASQVAYYRTDLNETYADGGGSACQQADAWRRDVPGVRLFGPCTPCGPGEVLIDAAAQPGSGNDNSAMMLCRTVSGHLAAYLLGPAAGGGCTRDPKPLPIGLATDGLVAAEAARVSTRALAGADGRVWTASSTLSSATPVFLDSVPTVAVAADGGEVVRSVRGDLFRRTPQGFVRTVAPGGSPVTNLNGTVAGAPGLGVFNGGVFDLEGGASGGRIVATSGNAMSGPATLLRARDGGTYLLGAWQDLLNAGPFQFDGGTPVALTQVSVPEPRFNILSVAAAPPADGGIVGAYALTQNALYRIDAYTELNWRAREVPTPPGDFAEVWTDGNRSRLGLRDGTILSLATMVPLSEPLPAPVLDYDVLCGAEYALTSTGLYELQLDGGSPLGSWAQVPLAIPAGSLTAGKLFVNGNRMLVLNAAGNVQELTAPSCPQ